MTSRHRLVKVGAVYVAVTGAQAAVGFAVLPLVTRVLEPAAFGQLAVATVVVQLTTVVTAAGIPVPVLRDHRNGSERSRAVASLGLVTATGIGGLLVALSVVAGRVGALDRETLVLAVGVGSVQGATECMQAFLRAQERARAWAIAAGLRTMGGPVVGVALAAVLDHTARSYLWGLLAAAVSSLLLSMALAKPLVSLDGPLIRASFAVGLPTVVHAAGMYLLASGDRVVLERILGEREVGRYQLAYIVGGTVILLVQAVVNAWSAIILSAEDVDRDRVLRETAGVVVPLAGASAVAVSCLGGWVLPFLAPAQFTPETLSSVVSLVAASGIFFAVYSGAVLVPMARGQTLVLLLLAPSVAVVNLTLNAAVADRYRLPGAAAATLASYVLLAVLARLAAGVQGLRGWPRSLDVLVLVACAGTVATGALPVDGHAGLARLPLGVLAIAAGVTVVLQSHGTVAVQASQGVTRAQ